MPLSDQHSDASSGKNQDCCFKTTHWSIVLAAGNSSAPGAREALEKLCRTYWAPIYACVRRKGRGPDDAQDLTQEFFARLLEKKYFALADRERGRFRSFLLTALGHFLVNDWRKGNAERRGAGQPVMSLDQQQAEEGYQAEPASPDLSPDRLFERRWALALLEQVLAQLRAEYEAGGKRDVFDSLKPFVWGEKSSLSQAEVAARLGTTENAVSQAVHRLRQRYGELLRAEVANTVAAPGDVEDELRHLLAAISA